MICEAVQHGGLVLDAFIAIGADGLDGHWDGERSCAVALRLLSFALC